MLIISSMTDTTTIPSKTVLNLQKLHQQWISACTFYQQEHLYINPSTVHLRRYLNHNPQL